MFLKRNLKNKHSTEHKALLCLEKGLSPVLREPKQHSIWAPVGPRLGQVGNENSLKPMFFSHCVGTPPDN